MRCSTLAALVWMLFLHVEMSGAPAAEPQVPSVRLHAAPLLQLPHQVDCNSPSHWDRGTLYVFMSEGHPFRSSGKDLQHLGPAVSIQYDNKVNGGRWIEATCRADDGKLYGWYHIEPSGLCPGTTLTAPKIGAVRSDDNGATWKDLGIILEARPGTLVCTAQNGYFAGGHGDFCITLDAKSEQLYLFYSTYAGDAAEQGVAVARMAWKDRDAPVGKVEKWLDGSYKAPGVGGRQTPFLPVFTAWERADCDAFWGPSIHWNTHLQQYVMLLNRAKGKGWNQEGIYISFSTRLDDPRSWSRPVKIHDGGSWYPVVQGLEPEGTDKLAGRKARFFMARESKWEIEFLRPGEAGK